MTSKKSFKKTGCVRGKPGACLRWLTVRSTSAGHKTACQRGLPGVFLLMPINKGITKKSCAPKTLGIHHSEPIRFWSKIWF